MYTESMRAVLAIHFLGSGYSVQQGAIVNRTHKSLAPRSSHCDVNHAVTPSREIKDKAESRRDPIVEYKAEE